jgi:hypothetical protein
VSREERRAYQRMTKNRDPYAMPAQPAQQARLERARTRRAASRSAAGGFRFVTGRFLTWLAGGAGLVGLLTFSVAWPSGMPTAAYVGLAGAVAWTAAAIGVRFLQRRAASLR